MGSSAAKMVFTAEHRRAISEAAKRRWQDPAQRDAVAASRRAYTFKKHGGKSWEQRFWGDVDKSGGADACWPWTKFCDKDGYGCCQKSMGDQRAHRAAYKYTKGDIPYKLCVLHSCDNPPCCNPAHLSAGTHKDNGLDKSSRNRAAWGTHNGNSKLSSSKVTRLRSLWAYDPYKYTAIVLSYMFGVSPTHVYYIVNRKNWVRL